MSESDTATDDPRQHGSGPGPEQPRDSAPEEPAFTPDDGEEQFRQVLEHQYAELEDRYDEIRTMAEAYNRSAMEFIREHPAICIGAAAGAGYVLGRLASKRWLK